jgi:hypothetical protein
MSEENVHLRDRENVEMVRKPLRVRERSSRTLDQRFFLRFPRVNAAFARLKRAAAPVRGYARLWCGEPRSAGSSR